MPFKNDLFLPLALSNKFRIVFKVLVYQHSKLSCQFPAFCVMSLAATQVAMIYHFSSSYYSASPVICVYVCAEPVSVTLYTSVVINQTVWRLVSLGIHKCCDQSDCMETSVVRYTQVL